jgi:hypothetical protein
MLQRVLEEILTEGSQPGGLSRWAGFHVRTVRLPLSMCTQASVRKLPTVEGGVTIVESVQTMSQKSTPEADFGYSKPKLSLIRPIWCSES